MTAIAVRAIGLVSGAGRGADGQDGIRAASGVVRATPAAATVERLRRATRECVLAVEAVEALLEDGGLSRDELAGSGTALVYVTAAAYGASNRAFIEGGGGALHFPYTAPSAVPAEVAIAFGMHGPYAVLLGGAATTIDAIEHARVLLARGACERALVLAVETFEACADVLARGSLLNGGPLVEAAAAALLIRHAAPGTSGANASAAAPGESFACAPLIALAMARARGERLIDVRGTWRGRAATTTVGVARTIDGKEH